MVYFINKYNMRICKKEDINELEKEYKLLKELENEVIDK